MVSDGSSNHQHPIVGREREREQLRACLAHALDGHGSLVLISGEAGIGKTALVQNLVQHAREQGVLIVNGGCYDLTATPPYGPWLEITGSYPATDSMLPSLPAPLRHGGDMAGISSQTALFELARDFLVEVSARQPLLLVLEDLHWVDLASLELLRYLGRSLEDVAMLLVVTYRDDEVTRRHELYQLLPLLVHDCQAERIHLNRLDEAAIHQLVEHRYPLDNTDRARLAAHLVGRSEGNPFFATEILHDLEDEQVLQPSSEGWRLGDLTHVHVPTLVRQVIDARFNRLSAETRTALQAAAVIGQTVPLDRWQALTAFMAPAFERVLDEALEARVVEESLLPMMLRFRHALLRDALYESLTLSQRRLLHRQAGEALSAMSNPDPDEVAHHFQEAGDPRAVDWLMIAGERATRTYAWRTAIERFDAAAHLMESDANRAQDRGRLLFRLGRLVRWSNPAAGVTYLIEAHQAAAEIGDQALEAYALADCGLLHCYAGEIRRGIEELAAGVELLETLPVVDVDRVSRQAWTVEGLLRREHHSSRQIGADEVRPGVNPRRGTLANWLAATGRFTEAMAMASSFLADIAPGSIHRDNQDMEAYYALGLAYAEMGRPDDACAMLIRAREMYQSIHHHSMVAAMTMVLLARVTIPYRTTDLAERERLAREAEAAWSEGRDSLPEGLAPVAARAAVLSIAGQWRELQTTFADEAIPLSARFPEWTVILGRMFRSQGTPARAREQVQKILPEGPASDPGGHWFGAATEAQRLAVDLALDEADLSTAHIWLETHDRWLEWSGAVRGRAEAQLLWARYQQTAGDLEAARHHAERALEHASCPRQPLALIAAYRLLGRLETEAGRHSEAAGYLQASLQLAATCEAPYERALTMLECAELAAESGERDKARRLLSEVRNICQPLKAERSLEHAEQIEARLHDTTATCPAGLSAREVEVLALVAEGMTNAEAGAALFISHRTVAQHLRSVYNKLGVDNRTAAVARWAELLKR